VTYAKTANLRTNPNNPRAIRKDQLNKLVKSLQEFPEMLEARPIVIDKEGTVLGGNMRLKAAQLAGLDEVPVYVREWDEGKDGQFIIKDNVSFGEWDQDMLANEWEPEQLDEWGLNIDWDEPEETEGLTDADDVPEVPEEATTKLGDVWVLGEHRVMCGDSTNAADVALLMDGEKAVLLHADPPYGMGKEKDGVLNDNLYSDKLDKFQLDWWKAFRPHLEDNASAYIWGNAPDLWRLWYRGGLQESEPLTMRNEVVWFKPPSGLGDGQNNSMGRSFGAITERALFFMLGEQGFNNNADNYWEGWEPIRTYLVQEMKKCGWTTADLNRITGTQMAGHWVTKSQWGLITAENYNKIKQAAQEHDAFKREHDDLKREHDDLKREHDRIKEEWYETRAFFDNTHDNMTEVWQFERVKGADRHRHATPKPVEMMQRVMKSSAPNGAVTVEPFLGSGSTLIGAEKTGRKCYGMELDPKYCDVIVKRWEEFTGKKAELWKP